MPDEDIPPPEPHVRMEYRRLQVALEPVSTNTTRASLIMDVDPKLDRVPQSGRLLMEKMEAVRQLFPVQAYAEL